MTLMWAGNSRPEIVTVFEVRLVLRATFVCASKVNGFGSVSQVRRVNSTLTGARPVTVNLKRVLGAVADAPPGIVMRYSCVSRIEIDA